MCGIVGIYGKHDTKAAHAGMKQMAHRGPDGKGLWRNDAAGVVLGHVRLSIFDISARGAQPMTTADQQCVIVYNGEIYNFRELRGELEGRGVHFNSETDTEVVLEAYVQWGEAFVDRLRGMFALAILDLRGGLQAPKLVLARDRVGIKPLYYTERAGTFYFASEVRSLLAMDAAPPVLSPEAVSSYMMFGAVGEPMTAINGIKAFPPGHLLNVKGSHRFWTRYWDLDGVTATRRSELANVDYDQAVSMVRAELHKAASYHVLSDVPVGAFLSGGVDSVATVGLMQHASNSRVKTFSMGFESASGKYSELHLARQAARWLGTEHHELVTSGSTVQAGFDDFIQTMDQPTVDGLNTWLVSRFARSEVTVALSGLGGDELFLGYPHFSSIQQGLRWTPKGSRAALFLLKILSLVLGRRAPILNPWKTLFVPYRQKFFEPRLKFTPQQVSRAISIIDNNTATSPQAVHDGNELSIMDVDAGQEMTRYELTGYLRDTLLRDADVFSMAHALELRPILLDHKVVELVYAMPEHVKLDRKRRPKALLVDATKEFHHPELLLERKRGFYVPVVDWLRGTLRHDGMRLLNTGEAKRLFTDAYRRRQLVALETGQATPSTWQAMVLVAWIAANGIECVVSDSTK